MSDGQIDRAIQFAKQYGVMEFGREAGSRSFEILVENVLGIQTTGVVLLEDVGIRNEDAIDSMPIYYPAFFRAVMKTRIDRGKSVFLDYGVGKGRSVCAAALFPFQKIVGVDLSSALIGVARQNIQQMRFRRVEDVDLVCTDAKAFAVPDDVDFIHMYNPFLGETMNGVLRNICDSLIRCNREVKIIVFNNREFDALSTKCSWIRKTAQLSFYRQLTCGLYVANANAITATV